MRRRDRPDATDFKTNSIAWTMLTMFLRHIGEGHFHRPRMIVSDDRQLHCPPDTCRFKNACQIRDIVNRLAIGFDDHVADVAARAHALEPGFRRRRLRAEPAGR